MRSQALRAFVAVAMVATVASLGCGGDSDQDQSDANSVDGAGMGVDASDAPASKTFTIITHSPLFGMGRARLVAYRNDSAPWAVAPEATIGEYTWPVTGSTMDAVIVCYAAMYDDVQVQFLHLSSEDILEATFPCTTDVPTARVTGTVTPSWSKLYIGRSLSFSGGTGLDFNVHHGTIDAVVMSSTRVQIRHDIEVIGPTTLDFNLDSDGSPLGQVPLTVSGVAADETITLRSAVHTRNGITAVSDPGALLPLAQLVDGDVRRVSATAVAGQSATRQVSVFSNADGSTSVTLPPRLAAASYQPSTDGLGSFSWAGAFPDRSAIRASWMATDAKGQAATSYLSFISRRRQESSGIGESGTYVYPETSAIPGWEAGWNPLGSDRRWEFIVEGQSRETAFGAEPTTDLIRWTTTLRGVAPTIMN